MAWRRNAMCFLGWLRRAGSLADKPLLHDLRAGIWNRPHVSRHMADVAAQAPPSARLHYLAVEGLPLRRAEVASFASRPGANSAISAARLCGFIRSLSPAFIGYSRDSTRATAVCFSPLLCGDVLEMLRQLRTSVDAWFLDGFAPDRIPEMWSPDVFSEMARSSSQDARISRPTPLRDDVHRGLSEAGFNVERAPGSGSKREMLRGSLAQRRKRAQSAPLVCAGGRLSGAVMPRSLAAVSPEPVPQRRSSSAAGA